LPKIEPCTLERPLGLVWTEPRLEEYYPVQRAITARILTTSSIVSGTSLLVTKRLETLT